MLSKQAVGVRGSYLLTQPDMTRVSVAGFFPDHIDLLLLQFKR